MNRALCLLAFSAFFRLHAHDLPVCAVGIQQASARDYRDAQISLWNCLLDGNQHQAAAYYLGLTYRELKNYVEGLEKTEAALKLSPKNEDFLYLAAYLHYRLNQPRYSMVLLSKAYQIEPEDWRVHQLFALNYILFRMPEAVELELKKAIRLNGSNAELHYQLGRFYYSEEHFEPALEEMKCALAISDDYSQAYDSLGLCYEALQDFKRAGDSYSRAIELNDKHGIRDEWPLLNYGTMLFREVSAQAGLPYLMAALKINPNSPKANYQAGRATRFLKRNNEAEAYFQKTIEADSTYVYAYYQLATLVRERGDQKRAAALMAQYKTLVDQEPHTGTYNPSAAAHAAR